MANFVNNPINSVASISPRQGATFHRLIAKISVGGRIFEQSYAISDDTTQATFDISSSIRAYVDSLQNFSAVTGSLTYKGIDFSVSYREEYMQNGTLHIVPLQYGFSSVALLGGYTDLERISGADFSRAEFASFTLRPSSPMLVPSGHHYLCYSSSGTTRSVKMSNMIAPQENYSSGRIYQVSDSRLWYDFQFINSRGIHESAFAFCNSKDSVKGGVQTHIRSLRETFSSVSRRINVVEPASSVLSFSSGYVDIEWAKWWAYEFCKANKYHQHWIKLDGLWVPCSVTLNDNFSIDRSKTQMVSVDFDVVPDLNGMI